MSGTTVRPGAEVNPRTQPILEATLQLIGREGPRAVTHRAVAREAGVSTGAIAHHFASRDALIEATLLFMGRREIEGLEQLALALQASAFDTEQWVDGLAATMAARIEYDRTGQIAVYELLIESARSERVRAVMEQMNAAFLRLAELGFRARATSDPELHGRLLVATMTGAMLKQLAYPVDDFEHDVLRPLLAELVEKLAC
jgi:TetR/AcrR family transcriptional regulator, regulator of biofilm formation and stress response